MLDMEDKGWSRFPRGVGSRGDTTKFGQFSQALPEYPVFGQVRYMSLASTGRKFDAKSFIAGVDKLERYHA